MVNWSPNIYRVLIAGLTTSFSHFLCLCVLAQWIFHDDRAQRSMGMQHAVQKKAWEPIFFKTINRRASLAKLSNLGEVNMPKDDLELRVWIGFGVIPLEGIIVKKNHGQWSAVHLRSIGPRLDRRDYQQALLSPKSGWGPLWQNLVEKGVITLPDSSELAGEVLAFDGESVVVEINKGGSYRTYLYRNPHLQKWPQARTAIEIVQTILDEFNIQRELQKAKS